MDRWIKVKDMFKFAQDNNLMLLSGYQADFWDDYRQNHDRFDSLFKTLYKSYRYFDQDIFDKDLNTEDVTREFIYQVQNYLMLNKKKYEEMYRIESLTDENYKLFDNINYEEKRDGTAKDDATTTEGSRSDSSSETQGSRTDTREEQVSAFNSSTYTNANKVTDNKGAETDSTSYTKGQQQNILDRDTENHMTITRKGKISGVSTQSLIREHNNLWKNYEFYAQIFSDIANEFLLI